jgi:hypothetical protein
MAKAKVESQAHGNNDQGHGKAMAKDHINLPRRKHELKS